MGRGYEDGEDDGVHILRVWRVVTCSGISQDSLFCYDFVKVECKIDKEKQKESEWNDNKKN